VRGEEPKLSIAVTTRSLISPTASPVQGKPEIEFLWHKLRWHFASQAHRDLFAKDPDHYAPQDDGYCAMGVSVDEAAHKDTVDPEAWAIVDDKLYLVHNQYWLQEKAEEHIKQANRDGAVVKNLAAPEIVGPPCAASPPHQGCVARRRAFGCR
jgi:hypothetical protein